MGTATGTEMAMATATTATTREKTTEPVGVPTRAPPDEPPFPSAERLTTPRTESVSPPRLVFRFALYTAIGLALAAAGILLFVRQHGIAQAEQSVTFHAGFVANSTLRDRLRPSDFARPLSRRRQRELDSLFRREVLVGGTLAVTLYAPGGRIAYSSDRRSTGTAPRASDISTEVESRAGAKVLTVFVPVRQGAGRTPGVFALHQDYGPIASSARKAFLPVAGVLELALLGLYISFFPILRRVTRRLRGHLREIEHQALHDGLTGLPNRDLFHARVDEALVEARQRNAGVAVLLLDLDRFKEINDTLGHQSGDLLLQALAKRLVSLIRTTDTVARLGGDEFAIVSPGAGDGESALRLADRIRAGLEEPFVLDGLTLEIEASVGIALFPQHGEDVEALVRHADVAMYVGKKTHRPNLYSVKDDHYSPDRLALVGELRRAVTQSELVVHYQPRVEMATGQTRSVEALVRWEHPDRGLLSPAEFLPLAEHTGLIRPVTRYVLEAALADCASWQRAGPPTGVSVNLSPRDLLDFELAEEVEGLLAKHGIEPALLELEITENTILTDPERVRAVLGRLRELGVTLAIDDFGTGFSSLGQLKRLPVDIVKIDKSFVLSMAHDENDDVIVRSTIDLGHNLGLRVVAEGVETQETWDRLAALGCDTAQGFYLSRPLPKLVLDDWLRKRASDTGAGHLRLVG
jgi:diguanylate cyclase (GGDEF)-like protein